MNNDNVYDVAIAGAGLAGLSASILLAKKGYKVVLFEKETFPFHKVCGEYISLESKEFLVSLGLHLDDWRLPVVDELSLSSPGGRLLKQRLPLGGFGISRYKIDNELVKIALQRSVAVLQDTRVHDVVFENDGFNIITGKGDFRSRVCCMASGKRSNLDVKRKRRFILQRPNALNNYVAVKYHARLPHPRNNIALHNFNNGYCGIAPIEDDKTCICYLTTASNLRKSGNDIRFMQEKILARNPFLKEAFGNAEMLYGSPLVISQVSFSRKEQVNDHVLMLGDAAGLIAPLCGNGMSMALFSGKIASTVIDEYLSHVLSRAEMESNYAGEWKDMFGRRLRAGRIIQSLFGREWVTNLLIGTLRFFPGFVSWIIKQTHGTKT